MCFKDLISEKSASKEKEEKVVNLNGKQEKVIRLMNWMGFCLELGMAQHCQHNVHGL